MVFQCIVGKEEISSLFLFWPFEDKTNFMSQNLSYLPSVTVFSLHHLQFNPLETVFGVLQKTVGWLVGWLYRGLTPP